MAEPKIMSREQAFRYVEDVGRAALGGRPLPDDDSGCDCMRADDMGDATAAFARRVAERFDTIPGRITDNVKVQEMLRQHLDEVMSDLAATIEATVAIYKE